jgi:hypothetical protein
MKALMWIGVLGIALVVVAIVIWFSTYGEQGTGSVFARNERTDTVVLFFCHETSPLAACTGRRMPPRSTERDRAG